MLYCATSWSADAGAPVYIYRRRDARLPAWWSGQLEGVVAAVALALAWNLIQALWT